MSERVKQFLTPERLFNGIFSLGLVGIGLCWVMASLMPSVNFQIYLALFLFSVYVSKIRLDENPKEDSAKNFLIAIGVYVLILLLSMGYVFVRKEVPYSLINYSFLLIYFAVFNILQRRLK